MCACGNKSNAASAEVTKIQDNQMTTQPDSNSVVVDITTSLGDIKVLLYGDTPKHRDNFVKLVNEGFYNGVLFHRVINEFMIQAGDPEPSKPNLSIPSTSISAAHWPPHAPATT